MTDTDFDLYADENKPEVKFFRAVYRLELPWQVQRTFDRVLDVPFHVCIAVADDGLVDLEPNTWWFGKQVKDMDWNERREILDWLVEWEIAEWKAISPEDAELFVTQEFLDRLEKNEDHLYRP